MLTVFVTGSTCVGKTTLLDYCKEKDTEIAVIKVGQILRKRYTPDYFEGQGAPQKTEKEAMEILKNRLRLAKRNGTQIVLIDGQPRTKRQVKTILEITEKPRLYLKLFCSDDVKERRMKIRDKDESLALSESRILIDQIDLEQTLIEMFILAEQRPTFIRTESPYWMEHAFNYIQGVHSGTIANTF